MNRYWYEKECPWDSREAYREGHGARRYDENPYQHGEHGSDYRCREAFEEFERGQRAAEYERRQEQERQEMEERREAQHRRQRQEEAAAQMEAEWARIDEQRQAEEQEDPQP